MEVREHNFYFYNTVVVGFCNILMPSGDLLPP